MITTAEKYMPVEYEDGGLKYIKIENAGGISLYKTFDCGQCFRFEPLDGTKHGYEVYGTAFSRAVSFASDGDCLYIYNSDAADFENIWRGFLNLDNDYDGIDAELKSRFSDSDGLVSAIGYGRGIHILCQEPWETICSFIISQNNNIPRIKKLVAATAEKYGERIACPQMKEHGFPDGFTYSFPSAQMLEAAGVEGLFALRTGFRAKYLYDAAKKVSSGEIGYDFMSSSASTAECEKYLCRICGIGPKVACCILLFAFAKYDAFPIDVWVKRALVKYFPSGFEVSDAGAYAGILQQYMFYFERYKNGI